MTQALVQKKKEAFAVLQSSDFKKQLAAALPRILPTDKFVRTCITAINKNPKLAECTQESLFGSIISLAQGGIEADGYHAHLIPYGRTCTPVIDYKGLIEMMYRTGLVASVNGYVVKENDEFEWSPGEKPVHKVKGGKRGVTTAAYTIVTMKDGTQSVEVMFADEIDAIKNRSKAGSSGPWKTDYDEMAKKTVLKRHSKWVPIASEAKDIIMKEIESEFSKPEKVTMSVDDLVAEPQKEPEMKEADATVIDDFDNDDFDQAVNEG